jgi:hypothetical protein
MITNTGKSILAKYLIGQAPAYASHIAIGCGAKPLASDGTLGDYSGKQSLDFEMFRVPIISRGYVTEAGQSKIVFTAELPTAERYEITEVGVWSAGANPSAGAYDSKTIYSFSETENWQHHTQTNSLGIPSIQISLGDNNVIAGSYKLDSSRKYSSTGTPTELPVFQTNADNPTFTNSERVNRYERCRFLNNIMMIRGDMSNLSLTGGVVGIPTSSTHIHLTGAGLDFDKNALTDQLKLAFSVVNKDGESSVQPDEVRIVVEFSDTDEANATGAQYARFQAVVKETDLGVDFATNRYFVSTVALQNLLKTSGFTWKVVDTVKIYATVIKGTALVSSKSATATVVTLTTSTNHSFSVGDKIIVAGLGNSGRFDGTFEITEVASNTIKYNSAGAVVSSTAVSPTVQIASPSDDYYIALDALRLENITSSNPVYGLSGYSVIKNTGAQPILKFPNTTNHIEFRFGMDVL